MSRHRSRLHRLLAVCAAALVLGVAAHGALQAIEHHDGVGDAVVLCAAAVALVATAVLAGGGRTGRRRTSTGWVAVEEAIPNDAPSPGLRHSAAWLQRFRN